MATRSRTQLYVRMRSSLKTHRNADKPRERLHIHQEGRIDRGLMNASDGASDGDSAVDARIYTVPPTWVTLVDEINRAVSKIKIGRALPHAAGVERGGRAGEARGSARGRSARLMGPAAPQP